MIRDLTAPADDPDLFRRAFDEVLRPSFSPEELPGIDDLAAALSGSSVMAVATDGDEVAAVAVAMDAPEVGIGLLSYVAARPGLRSRGHGGALLAHLRQRWAAGPCSVALGEIHDPRWWPETPSERPMARLRFYERQGCGLLAVPWVQPRLRPDLDRVGDMLLVTVHSTEEVRRDGVDGALLRLWTEGYYAEEGSVPTDAQYRALVDRMGGSRIPVWPLDRFEDLPRLHVDV